LTINPNEDRKFSLDTVKRFANKLKLDKSNKEAEAHFEEVFVESMGAVMTLIQDDLHWYKVKWLNPITNAINKVF